MNSLYVDLIAVALIVVNLLLGWKFGILGRALALGGLYGGVAAATAMSDRLLRFFGGGGAANDLYASAWTYVGVVFGVVAAVETTLSALPPISLIWPVGFSGMRPASAWCWSRSAASFCSRNFW